MIFQKKIALSGSQREPVTSAVQTSPVDKDELVQATVVLRGRPQSQFTTSAQEFGFSDPRTVNYLSREEFGLIHGAATSDIETIEAFAHEFGLTVTERSTARRCVVLTGTAECMQKAFGTTLANYAAPGGTYRGRTGPIVIPEELQPLVTAVLGLDNRPVAKPHVRVCQVATKGPAGLSPIQIAQLYNFPTGFTGAGQTIGIIELGGGYRPADLHTYFKDLGIPAPTVTTVSVDGGFNQPGVNLNCDAEVMLDIEVAGALAPGARIVVYFAPNTDQGFHDAITCAVHDTVNKPSVISISWGAPEDTWTEQARNAMLAACTDAAAVGVTITAAAGDDGATDGVPDNKLHVDLPAALPTVLACGGTHISITKGTIASETVWNELAQNEGATGGGVSRIFPRPAYQNAAGVPLHPETKFAGRGIPDVAGNADPVTGYLVRVDGKNIVIGGTSAVAPLWAGLIAILNQQLGRPVGFVNPILYQIGVSAFRDITTGNNNGFSAGNTWDPCTGLGSPNGVVLAEALLEQGQAVTVTA